MHILPALHQLELDIPQGLLVVGVHSGKFSNEKNNDNILKCAPYSLCPQCYDFAVVSLKNLFMVFVSKYNYLIRASIRDPIS